eukprot:4455264-Alexandrium_andersonii.AAC.1
MANQVHPPMIFCKALGESFGRSAANSVACRKSHSFSDAGASTSSSGSSATPRLCNIPAPRVSLCGVIPTILKTSRTASRISAMG